MALRVAISGFSRIGRLVFRRLSGDRECEVAAIYAGETPETLAYLLKYDTPQGSYPFAEKLSAGPDSLIFRGKPVKVLREGDDVKLPWKKLGVDLVLECFPGPVPLLRERAAAHLAAGAKRVLIAAPAGEEVPTAIFGVNEKAVSPRDRIISAASPSANCLALLARALNDYAPLESGIALTIRGSGEGSAPAEGETPRRFRGEGPALAPEAGEAAQIAARAIPGLGGKLTGSALRCPPAYGSLVVLTAVLRGGHSAGDINRALKAASSKSFGWNEDEILSTDLGGMSLGALFDAAQTLALPLEGGITEARAAAWYDGEGSHAAQIARLVKHLAKLREEERKKSAKPAPAAEEKALPPPSVPRKPLIKYPS
jgi:glyceraldehyde 3-phosphate dehydrogenase